MSESRQSYENHRLRLSPLYLAAGLVLLAGAVLAFVELWRRPSLASATFACLGIGGIVLWASVRVADIRLQDRVIRAEMRARWDRVLGAHRRLDFERLSLKQVIALRFACDAEFPALAEEVLAHPELDADALKRKVRDWQADHLRV